MYGVRLRSEEEEEYFVLVAQNKNNAIFYFMRSGFSLKWDSFHVKDFSLQGQGCQLEEEAAFIFATCTLLSTTKSLFCI